MKIRNGFVSNSSSSSFIIGIGKIKDINIFCTWIEKNKMSTSDLEICLTSEILNKPHWTIGRQGGEIYTTGCVNHDPKVSIPFDPNKEEHYCIVNIGNDEGDDSFWDGDEMDYDISEDYFCDYQATILNMLQEGKMLSDCQWDFGAARNG